MPRTDADRKTAPRVGSSSPWGTIDSIDQLAPGIIGVGTPRHGGIWLSPPRRRQIPASVLEQTFAAGQGVRGWLEEDQDASIAITAFRDELQHRLRELAS